jgi:hypothetical protein
MIRKQKSAGTSQSMMLAKFSKSTTLHLKLVEILEPKRTKKKSLPKPPLKNTFAKRKTSTFAKPDFALAFALGFSFQQRPNGLR